MDIKVAIFEDSKSLRLSLQQLIDSEPGMYCAGAFADANTLIKDMRAADPDVVLMDIHMPGISGIEAVQVVKEKFPGVRILMQTVFEDNDKIFAAICAGATGYMLKKTRPLEMIQAIREIWQGGAPMTASVAAQVIEMFRLQSAVTPVEFIDLTDREKQILQLLVQGRSYAAIAKLCFITIDTVSTHIKHIYEKLQVHSKSEAVVKAIRQRLV